MTKRPDEGIWGGLWWFEGEFTLEQQALPADLAEAVPKANTEFMVAGQSHGVNAVESLPEFKHTFSHFHLHIQPVIVYLAEAQIGHVAEASPNVVANNLQQWVDYHQPADIGLCKPAITIFNQLQHR